MSFAQALGVFRDDVREKAEELQQSSEARESAWVGTVAEHAKHVEFGTGPHETSNDQEGFIRRMKQWAKAVGIDEEKLFPIMEDIREHGTEPKRFWVPATEAVASAHGFDWEQVDADTLRINIPDDADVTPQQIVREVRSEMIARLPRATGSLKRSIAVGSTRSRMEGASQGQAPERTN